MPSHSRISSGTRRGASRRCLVRDLEIAESEIRCLLDPELGTKVAALAPCTDPESASTKDRATSKNPVMATIELAAWVATSMASGFSV